jgi:outer membrane protein assembly factor BamB
MIMVIFAALGAAMLSLFSTSISSSATANESRRAFFLAEAGLRYGLSELRQKGFTTLNITTLNDTIFKMPPSGEFDITVFGAWFKSPSNQSVAGGTLSVEIDKGRIPPSFFENALPAVVPDLYLVVASLDPRSPIQKPNAAEVAKVNGFSYTAGNDTSFTFDLADNFVVGNNKDICMAIQPLDGTFTPDDPSSYLDLNLAALKIFPKTDGSFQIGGRIYFYKTAKEESGAFRLRGITAGPGVSLNPVSVTEAGDYILLSPTNYFVTSKGTAGQVISGGGLDSAASLSDHDFQSEPDIELDISKVGQVEDNASFITGGSDAQGEYLRIGGISGSALGGLWYNQSLTLGGATDYCDSGKCFFEIGIRVFFTLGYTGSGDGLIFALPNGQLNQLTSIGGDFQAPELLGYAGDSRLNNSGSFLDTTGIKGLRPPKIGLEFDTKVNYSSTLEESLKYCSGSNLNADTRNDPGASGKDAVQYVFWGNSSLNVPCRKEPYCGGVSTCKGDPSYDDNRHNAIGDGTQNWSQSTGERIRSSPTVGADGTIYVGSYDGNLYAINPDGSLKWTFGTGDRVYSPTVAGSGTIYVGSADGNLYAVNPDGSFRWSYLTGGAVRTKPAVHTSGIVYFGSDDGRFYAVSSGGAFIWSFDTFAPVQSSPAFSNAGNIVYFGSDNGTFYGLTVGNGLIFGTITPFPANAFRSSPAVGPGPNGTIYVGSDNGSIYAFNSSLTSILWSVPTGEAVRSSPAVGSDGTVYIGSFNDYLYALDTSNGAEKWKFRAGNNVQSPIAIDGNNHIYFGSDDDKVYALYADGSEKWSFTTGGDVRGKPLVMPDGTVYAGSYDFRLYAINQFANPKNYRDLLITYSSGSVGGVSVTVDNTNDWLKGASSKGPWAVRMEIKRDQIPDGNNYYSYELKTWLRQCNTSGCSGINDPIGTFYEDTRVKYAPDLPTPRPAQLVQTIKLSSAEHQDFERFIFGFTSQTGAGDLQTATIRNFQLSFIRPGDPTVTNDPNWP